jgi:hypothetical protein
LYICITKKEIIIADKKIKIMTTTKTAIGQLKSKITKHCTICGCSTRRNLTACVYENTPTEIERAKQEIKEKAAKKYTCRICKSIERDLSK